MNPIASGHTGPPGPLAARAPAARNDAVLRGSQTEDTPQVVQTRAGARVQRVSAAGLAQVHALLTYSDNAAARRGELRGHNLDLYA